MKIATYIAFISDCFEVGNYPFQNSLELFTKNQAEQILTFNHKIIADFERILQLQFVEKTAQENVCFADQNSELQDDFKQVFMQKDLLDYFYAVLFASEDHYVELEKTCPKSAQEFWHQTRLGEKLRVSNLKR